MATHFAFLEDVWNSGTTQQTKKFAPRCGLLKQVETGVESPTEVLPNEELKAAGDAGECVDKYNKDNLKKLDGKQDPLKFDIEDKIKKGYRSKKYYIDYDPEDSLSDEDDGLFNKIEFDHDQIKSYGIIVSYITLGAFIFIILDYLYNKK